MPKRLGIVFVAIGALLVIAVVLNRRDNQPSSGSGESDTISVVASFYPLYYFASAIAGEDASVYNLTPAGVEPHEYEPTSGDIARLEQSNLLIFNGAGLEPWADKIWPELEKKGVAIVAAGGDAATLTAEEDGVVVIDSHVWLSPVLASHQVDRIAEGFTSVDPDRAVRYRERAAQLKQKLAELDQQYAEGLKQCARQEFITSHNAFGYLANQYNLKQIAIAGLSPDAEPSAKELARIAQLARDHSARVIFFESLVSPKLSQTIAANVGAQTLGLNPLEGLTDQEIAQGQDYFTLMRKNLENLRVALECK